MGTPPFPSFAASAVYQIGLGLMDDYLDAIIAACEDRRKTLSKDGA